jgi:hypothetical protein
MENEESYGALPHTPPKGLFENLLAYARGEFACGKYREGSLESQKL